MGYSRTASLSLLLFLSWAQIFLIIPSENGSIPTFNAGSPSGLVYRTDFENVTKQDAHRLNMGISNWFEFGGDGGAAMWMEGLDRQTTGITCHSGSRCVGMELTDITNSRRSEFDLYPTIAGNEYFVSVWLYLPADWRLHTPNNWYELANPSFTNGPTFRPYSAIHISQPDITKDVFNLDLDDRGTGNVLRNYAHVSNFALPRGRWFNLQYYVLLHPTNGTVKVWIDGALLFDINNLSTKSPSVAEWSTSIAKIYYDTSDTFSPYRIWVDDLEIYNAQPAIPGFAWESILVGVIMGLGALAVMRRRRNLASS